MKKKIIISIIFVLILIIGITSFTILNNRTISIITLDINPSIQINITRNEKVKSVIPLNEDAKKVINNSLKNKPLKEALNIITENVISKGFIEDDQVVILLYSEGIDNKQVKEQLSKCFEEKNIFNEIITVSKITKEDEKLARKHGISPAKASYINSIKKKNNNITIDDFINKPIKELRETKERDLYCEKNYFLDGDHCFKEIKKEPASKGMVCPTGYYEYNDKCYEEVGSEEGSNLICREEFTLRGDKCIREISNKAEPSKFTCSIGELVKRSDIGLVSNGSESSEYICFDNSKAVEPTLRCLTINHTIVNGNCYVGPAPVINGGCPNGDLLINGGCYSYDDGDQWVCPNGGIYHKSKGGVPKYCPASGSYSDPIISEFKCDQGLELRGSECISKEEEPAKKERICPKNYSLVDDGRCINYNKVVSKQNGYVCDKENSRLKGNDCIIYEIIEAKHS